MNNIDRYRNQHKIILSIGKALADASEYTISDKEFSSYFSVLKTLDEVLSSHLDSEDNYFYPELARDKNSTIQSISKRLQTEMLPISIVYENYKKKYSSTEKILDNKDSFVDETVFLVESLNRRIEKEEKELYSLL